jgi:photosystem II stability/assembly factor-like uncharacterized protein
MSINRIHRTIAATILVTFLTLGLWIQSNAGGSGNVFIDPDGLTRWTVVGPSGGDVRVITIDPRDKDRLYITTPDGQVHTSTDGGQSWRLLASFNLPNLVLDQLIVDRTDSNILHVSGHRNFSPGGYFRSTDGGKTWTESEVLKGESVHAMTQSIADPNTLYAGSPSGVFASYDSGKTWTLLPSPTLPKNINSLATDPRNTNILYAGTWWRPYKSTDSGKSWRLIKAGMIDDSDIFAINLNSTNPEHIVASACSGIYESLNGGENWSKLPGIPSSSRRTRDVLQHPSRPGVVYAGTTEGFWMSVNGGKSWSLTTQRNLEINSIAVHPDEPDRVFIGTNNHGVMVSNNGGRSFTQTNTSFTSRFANTVITDSELSYRLYATTNNTATSGGALYISNDRGTTWTAARGLDAFDTTPNALLQDRVNPNTMYLGSTGGVFRSADRGNSWSFLAPPRPAAPARSATTPAARRAEAARLAAAAKAGPALTAITSRTKILVHTEDERNGILAGTDAGLYRSYDPLKGWQRISFGEGIDTNVTAIFVSPLIPGTIWIGTAASGLVVSRDNGETWEKVAGPPEDVAISAIAMDPKRPNFLYVGSRYAFYLSRDGGRNWERRGGNLPLGNYSSILINPDNTDEIYAANALFLGGIYRSTDAGINWTRLDSYDMKLPSRRVWSMAFDPNDSNRIYAGSHSSGVYIIERKPEAAAAAATNDN